MTDLTFSQTYTVLSCHSLDDFPVDLRGDQANELLTCWCAPWHPQFIALVGKVPGWCSTLDLPEISESTLYIVPSFTDDHAKSQLSTQIQSAPVEATSQMVNGDSDLDTLVARLLDSTKPPGGNAEGGRREISRIDREIVRDFYALGYWYLQIQLLTRRMHYSSQLDEDRFREHLVTAARAAVTGEASTARDELSNGFSVLAEERDHYYPVDAYLLDLTLVAESTCGAALCRELRGEFPMNLALSGHTLQHMMTNEPDTLSALKKAIADDRAAILGGEWDERELPLLPAEAILAEFRRGHTAIEQLAGARPTQFVRRRFGLGPMLPLLLERFGYEGSLHATLDDGQFPVSHQSRVRWEGWGGAAVDSLSVVPLDAARDETFLALGERMGESMETDYVATVCLAHWPGRASQWYDMLRRGTRYGLALGRFTTFDQYFRDSAYAGQLESYDVDQYHSPYLKQAVERGEPFPISQWPARWQNWCLRFATDTLRVWSDVLADAPQVWCDLPDETAEASNATAQLQTAYQQAAATLAKLTAPAGDSTGFQIVNPWSSAQRVAIDWPDKSLPAVGKPVYASDADAQLVLADVPACGFATIVATVGSDPDGHSPKQPIVNTDDGRTVLRNEFLEAGVDAETGGLRFLYDFATRGNRLSQRLALCRGDRGTAVSMRADSVEVTGDTLLTGEITSCGKLYSADDEPLADFEQRFGLTRGSRILRLQLQLQPLVELGDNPWTSYFGCRFAWADESWDIVRDVQQTRHRTERSCFTAPLCIDLVGAKTTTSILAGGLPYHRQVAARQLDTLLIVRGEEARRFQFGIGVDLRYPVANAMAQLAPPIPTKSLFARDTSQSGWLFHVDARHVLATGWEAIWADPSADEPVRCTGFRVRLLETSGHGGQFGLRTYRAVTFAAKRSFDGRELADYEIIDGVVRIELAPYEWTEVEARW